MKSKKQMKEELHQLIDSIDDEQVLHMLNDEVVPYVLQNGLQEESEEELTPAQLKELDEAIEEAERGETISYEEFKESMDRWRTEYKSTKGLK
jgi:predicted transcriptional regulator